LLGHIFILPIKPYWKK